jgi:histidinol-phosphate aminotransferase
VPAFRKDLSSIGVYSPGKPIEEVMREYGVTDIVKMASNECPEEPFSEVQAAIATAALESHRYPDTAAYHLTNEIAAHHGVEPDQVWVGPGSTPILVSIALAMGGPGTSAVFSEQSFIMYTIATAYAGAQPIQVPIGSGLQIDADGLAAAIRPDTTVLYLCNPNNPTGTHIGSAAVAGMINKVPDDVLVVVDEAYEEYVNAPDHVSAIRLAIERDNVVVTRTFSKIYGLAGLRIGYVIGSAATIAELRRLQVPFATTNVSLAAAREALRHQQEVADRMKVNAAGRGQLADGLRALGIGCVDSQTNFLLMGPIEDAAELSEKLLHRGVIVRPFGDRIRITVGTDVENSRFLASLAELL